MGARKCQVCNEAQSKYKCPSCLAPYCSLGCFKKHKEIPCAKPEPKEEKSSTVSAEEKSTADPKLPIRRPLIVDDASEVLLKPQLESIASSSEIQSALRDESLRKLIRSIDSAADPESELEKAMGVEAFRIFTDKMLSTINCNQ
ncbi:zinc finger HIT domain-containing protein 3 [Jatropha curcas]|uniref:zinc finger HIT domain-containing protein 3 n=1 Tax=Jatropha curcas TaxID=180498 RepID=UPI0005FB73EE|nr:zinc finger HIT domain-containing protein 3 [Jatropha curcas]